MAAAAIRKQCPGAKQEAAAHCWLAAGQTVETTASNAGFCTIPLRQTGETQRHGVAVDASRQSGAYAKCSGTLPVFCSSGRSRRTGRRMTTTSTGAPTTTSPPTASPPGSRPTSTFRCAPHRRLAVLQLGSLSAGQGCWLRLSHPALSLGLPGLCGVHCHANLSLPAMALSLLVVADCCTRPCLQDADN